MDGQKAFEFFSFTNLTGATHSYRLVVGRFKAAGTPRFKFVMHQPDGIVAVQWHTSAGGDVVGPTLVGHAANAAGAAVAAVPFSNSGTVEFYSSRGPSTHCYGPVTGPIGASTRPAPAWWTRSARWPA